MLLTVRAETTDSALRNIILKGTYRQKNLYKIFNAVSEALDTNPVCTEMIV
jgi:hypothetical protein